MAGASALGSALLKCFNEDGDCTIIVTGQRSHGEDHEDASGRCPRTHCEFRVWSKLLGAWSDVFARMFAHDFKERVEGKIEIKDFSELAVSAFLRFLYSGELQVESTLLIEVGALADKYLVAPLQDLAAKRIEADLTPETACEMLEAADRMGSSTIKERCMTCICESPQTALARGYALSAPLLQEVLSAKTLCIDDFSLGSLLLDWAESPEGKARGLDVAPIFERHVHIAALDEKQYSKLRSHAERIGLGTLIQEMRGRHKRGVKTTDYFRTLNMMYLKQFPDSSKRPPFLGYWVNVIPSQASCCLQDAQSDSYVSAGVLESFAKNECHLELGKNEEMVWMTPHHGIYVTGVTFLGGKPKDAHIQLFASVDGATWHLLVSSKKNDTVPSIVTCSSRGCANWFKLCVLDESFNGGLGLHGIVLVM